MARQRLTDHQTWVILTAPDSVPNKTLAQELGVRHGTVRAARCRLKRHGWMCAISYVRCRVCQQPLTKRGSRAYHPACRKRILRQWSAEQYPQRWQNMSAQQRQQSIERAHRHSRQQQAQSQQFALNKAKRWQMWEDELIVREDAPADMELAKQLGRTLAAVRVRRSSLKRLE